MPRAFGDDERVAAEDDRDVVVPAGEPWLAQVIEPEVELDQLRWHPAGGCQSVRAAIGDRVPIANGGLAPAVRFLR